MKSEIVVPIFVKNKLAAELDIESYFAGTFTYVPEWLLQVWAIPVDPNLGW